MDYIEPMDDMDDEEYGIRNPDPVRREVLQVDTRPQWEKDMEEAMLLSLDDLDAKMKEQEQYEQECMAQFKAQQEERGNKVDPILSSLERLSKIDSKTKTLYELMEPILYSYKQGAIESCHLDEETYKFIFSSLRIVRLKQADREFLDAFFFMN